MVVLKKEWSTTQQQKSHWCKSLVKTAAQKNKQQRKCKENRIEGLLFEHTSQCLKITEKVSLNIASSSVKVQKIVKNAKNLEIQMRHFGYFSNNVGPLFTRCTTNGCSLDRFACKNPTKIIWYSSHGNPFSRINGSLRRSFSIEFWWQTAKAFMVVEKSVTIS